MDKDKYIGKKLEGRYEIQELTGMGGMSNVYKAYDSIDARTVAVKILRDEFLGNEEFLRMFKNESKAIAVLSHPNIVRVFDVSFTNHTNSIVMEYIDGITLKDYIERQGMLSWKEALHFALQILRALQHAHDKGIVHRDIKPHNIMLLQNGAIKVTDFGIAHFARSEVSPTIGDRAIGSVHYISPEQAMGDNTDEKSDLYSVGVMLFEMLTGMLPFDADTAVSVAIKQIQTPAARPRTINPDIPEGLEEITLRAMQKDSSRRYQSAAEMIADIEKFKQDPSILFAYKYMTAENEKATNKKYSKAITETREEEKMAPKKKRTPYIPILTGVTLAFVLAALSFIGLMIHYNNPFHQVEDTTLPNLVGLSLDDAIQKIDNVEIVVEESNYNSDMGKDKIYEQKPKAGTKIKYGSTVRVMVSLGQLVVDLPNFENKNASQSFAKIRDLGLDYREERLYSDSIPLGSVVYTEPSGDSRVSAGEIVTVYVSQGPEQHTTDVPSLLGLKPEDAKKLLELYKLRLGTVTEESSPEPSGTVISQYPAPGGGLQLENTAVDIVISKEGLKHLTILVPLPNVDADLTIRARNGANDELLISDIINPVKDDISVWKPVFAGESGSDEELHLKIYINRRLYQEYFLDFVNDSQRIGTDRSDSKEFANITNED